jgi:riboflavin transporter FmnP
MRNNITKKLVIAAMLTALAGVLMSIGFSIPFMPVFYKIDFSDVPGMFAVFALGPAWGAAVEIAKIVISVLIKGTNTMFVGEFANLISVAFFVLPIWFFYNKYGRNLKAAFIALSVSAVLRTIMACFINAFITLPMYAGAMGISLNDVIMAVSSANPAIHNLPTFIILATVPFNLIKIALNSVIGYFLYARLMNVSAVRNLLVSRTAEAKA